MEAAQRMGVSRAAVRKTAAHEQYRLSPSGDGHSTTPYYLPLIAFKAPICLLKRV